MYVSVCIHVHALLCVSSVSTPTAEQQSEIIVALFCKTAVMFGGKAIEYNVHYVHLCRAEHLC